jgi:transcriptional regulator with XRE-family HTH domain
MTTKKRIKRKPRPEASKHLEALMGGPLTLGAALSGLREADERSLAEFAKLLGVSRSHLCDIEHGRRAVSPERATRFARALDQSETQFVRLALQDQIRSAGLRLTVDVKVA